MRAIRDVPGRCWRRVRSRLSGDAGTTTVEYALTVVAGAAIATVLYKIVTSDRVRDALLGLILKALG